MKVFTKKWIEVAIPAGYYELKAINKGCRDKLKIKEVRRMTLSCHQILILSNVKWY